ncbi:MAG: RNase A-like domain-containing protein [Pyrinomonadaceae bacterium]
MPTPVNNTSGGNGTGGEPVTGNVSLKVSVKANVNLGKGSNAIHQLNERIGNDSQNPTANRSDNAIHHAEDGHQNKSDAPATRGNNGNHYGQLKNGNQGQPPKGNNVPPGQTPPIIEPRNQNPQTRTANLPTVNTPPFNPGTENPTTKIPTVNTPPIIQHPNQKNNPQHPHWNPPVIITTRTSHPHTPNGVLRNAVVEILRQNDIYLSRNVINNLVGNQNSHGNNKALNIPVEIRQLVQTVANQLSNTLNNSNPPTQEYLRQVSTEISNQLQSQINSARNVLLYAAQPDAKHFSNLNIQERVFLAVELMFRHLPAETKLHQVSNREIYNGLMFARGLVSSNEKNADIRNFVSFRSDVFPHNFSAAGLRDLGQLVKVLVTDASNAKTTVNLDLAVQKFIRILVANNELGVLLAATALSKQAELGTISVNRTLALVQIYQLISRLILAGEAAMKETAAKNGLTKNEFVGINLNKTASAEEKNALLRDLQTNNLHHNLKNFLEFNPAYVAERAVSSFVNADDARHAQQHFTSHHTDEIEQWLDSGNHRFVKEIELDKPIGIVVERGAEDFFSASKARIVLVRDSSAQGWHFLKSFLVT